MPTCALGRTWFELPANTEGGSTTVSYQLAQTWGRRVRLESICHTSKMESMSIIIHPGCLANDGNTLCFISFHFNLLRMSYCCTLMPKPETTGMESSELTCSRAQHCLFVEVKLPLLTVSGTPEWIK